MCECNKKQLARHGEYIDIWSAKKLMCNKHYEDLHQKWLNNIKERNNVKKN